MAPPQLIRRRRVDNGFTLFEGLAALAILALALATFSPAFGTAARNFARLEERLAAQQLASSLLEEQSVSRALPLGVVRGRRGAFGWQVITTLADAELAPRVSAPWLLYDITVIIEWAPQRRLELQTLRLARVP